MTIENHVKDQLIYERGDIPEKIYIIFKGKVGLFLNQKAYPRSPPQKSKHLIPPMKHVSQEFKLRPNHLVRDKNKSDIYGINTELIYDEEVE
jgi:hypothetical protein